MARLRLRSGVLAGSQDMLETAFAPGPPRTTATPRLAEHELLALFQAAGDTQVVSVPCLPRSLALASVLRHYGFAARIEIGMRRSDRGLLGHAWVERDGRVVGDADSFVRSFVRFQRAA